VSVGAAAVGDDEDPTRGALLGQVSN